MNIVLFCYLWERVAANFKMGLGRVHNKEPDKSQCHVKEPSVVHACVEMKSWEGLAGHLWTVLAVLMMSPMNYLSAFILSSLCSF